MGNLLREVRQTVGNPRDGLPEDLFLFVSELTPMINVDLLITNHRRETLLTWREDEYYGPGWHVPGGIIRFKETAAARIAKVAQHELGVTVENEDSPILVTEIMNPTRETRGHFISMLYRCTLKTALSADNAFSEESPKNNHWRWFSAAPENLIYQQGMYTDLIG
jgi:colanic acid biosynthesis protein WcaH